jgi:hypothetical protein
VAYWLGVHAAAGRGPAVCSTRLLSGVLFVIDIRALGGLDRSAGWHLGPIASRRSGPLGEPIDPQAAVARDGGDPLAVGEQADRVDCRSADVELAAPVWSRAVGEQEPRRRAWLIREQPRGLRAGYNLIWLDGLALAPDQWDFSNTPASGTSLVDGGSLFLHGANLGVERRW